LKRDWTALRGVTAAFTTVATFAKEFVPFYRIGSTAIFVTACAIGLTLTAFGRRQIFAHVRFVKDFLLTAALLYAIVVANYLVLASQQVPLTFLVGLLAFHSVFLLFGFAASQSLKTIYSLLLLQGVVYLFAIVRYAYSFGDVMRNGYLQDVFGIGVEGLYIALHQHIGIAFSLAFLAALGLGAGRARIATLAASPWLVLFLFHIAARAALVALFVSFLFWLGSNLWVRSRKTAIMLLVTTAALAATGSKFFYEYAINDKGVEATSPDAISRTIRELQSQDPGFRLQIWRRAFERIESNPRFMIGRGIGSYSIDEGFGAPTWLLDKSPKHYPHNTLIEMLYETGVAGFLAFGVLIILPLFVSLKLWNRYCAQEKAAMSIYVFYLAGTQLSGAFAYDYPFQFFLALAIGTIGATRARLVETISDERTSP
jgi:O-antigen ligase